jgi:hypothetical protein
MIQTHCRENTRLNDEIASLAMTLSIAECNLYDGSAQSRPAFPAYAAVNIRAKIFVACGASPVCSAEADESSNNHKLGCKDSMFRYLSKEIRTFIEQNEKHKEQEGYCHSKELPALTHPKILHNLFMVSCFHNQQTPFV